MRTSLGSDDDGQTESNNNSLTKTSDNRVTDMTSAHSAYILKCPDEVLTEILKHAVPNPAIEKRPMVSITLTCSRFNGLFKCAKKAKARHLAHCTYALAAVVRPFSSEEEKEGLLTTWIPTLHAISKTINGLTGVQRFGDLEDNLITTGFYIIHMLYLTHEPGTREWKTNFERLPGWCVKLVRLASIRTTTCFIRAGPSRWELVLSGSVHQSLYGLHIPDHVGYQGVEQCLLKDGVPGAMSRAVARTTMERAYNDTDIPTTLRGTWRKIAVCRTLKDAGNTNSMAYRDMHKARLDLLVISRLGEETLLGGTSLADYKQFEAVRGSALDDLVGETGEFKLAEMLKEVRAMIVG